MIEIKERVHDIAFVKDHINTPSLYEGLAEEAVEVAKEALKVARILRKENPTPANIDKTKKNLLGEIEDFKNYCYVLDLRVDPDNCDKKMNRWVKRIKETEEGKNSKIDSVVGLDSNR